MMQTLLELRESLNCESKHVRLAGLRTIMKIAVTEEAVDVLSHTLCRMIVADRSDTCVETAGEVLGKFLNSSLLTQHLIPVIYDAIARRLTELLSDAEHVRLALARLAQQCNDQIKTSREIICRFLLDICTDIVSIGLDIERKSQQLSVEQMHVVFPLLVHRSYKVRMSALSVVDRSLMRRNPWKSTFHVISCLAALRSDEIPVEEVFSPPVRVNYMSALTFDNNMAVRRQWFRVLIDWTCFLEDREDVDIHFCPYILTGMFDVQLGDEVTRWVEADVAPLFSGTHGWIQKCARRFMPAFLKGVTSDFQQCSSENTFKMLELVFRYIQPRCMIEYLSEVLSLCSRNRIKIDSRGIFRSIVTTLEPELWFDLVPPGPAYWWVVALLVTENSKEIPKDVIDYFATKLASLCNRNDHDAIVVLEKFLNVSSDNPNLIWAAILLEKASSAIIAEDAIIHEFLTRMSKIETIVTSGMIEGVLDIMVASNVATCLGQVIGVVKSKKVFSVKMLRLINKIDPKTATDTAIYFLNNGGLGPDDEKSVARHLCIFSEFAVSQSSVENLVGLQLSVPILAVLTKPWVLKHISPQDIKKIFDMAQTDIYDGQRDPLFALSFANFVLDALRLKRLEAIDDIVVCWVRIAMDAPECENGFTRIELQDFFVTDVELPDAHVLEQNIHACADEILLYLAHHSFNEFATICLRMDHEGYITRSAYLSKFIYF
jgi:hypothetical protein